MIEEQKPREFSHAAIHSETRLWTIEDLCRFTKLPKSRVYNLTFKRQLPFFKIGRNIRFRRMEVIKWLEKQFINP